MKKYLIIALLVFLSFSGNTQSISKELKMYEAENDSLRSLLIKIRESNVNSIRAFMTKINSLENTVNRLKSDTAGMIRQLNRCDHNRIKNIEDQLMQNSETINELKEAIKEKDNEIREIKKECEIKQQSKYTEGQQFVYERIIQHYSETSFDYLISISTLKSVERDLQLVGTNEYAREKLENLIVYFKALQVLGERHDQNKVINAKQGLSKIPQTDLIKELNTKLVEYRLRNEGLKSAIVRIINMDERFSANDENTRILKLRDIMGELSNYFYNYSFKFEDIPFLSNVVLEIMERKQRNPNDDISDILLRL
jgi:DNA repair exonuclease SbcCD ATPase subunit